MSVIKILSKWTLLLVTIGGIALAPVLILQFVVKVPTKSPVLRTIAFHVPEKAQPGLPMRLEIPKIGVDAALDYVGITSEGALGVPTGPAHAAWYNRGPRPGEIGDAVIDGHFGYKDHIPAVFDNLHALQKGDTLYIKDEKGLTAAFVVRELRTYASADYASAVFRSNDGRAHLNLITCEGTWNQALKSFSSRLVVFTDKVT